MFGDHIFNLLFILATFVVHPQNQSQLIWGIKDKLRKFCSTNDMKELLIANSQEVPSGESNVRDPVTPTDFRINWHENRHFIIMLHIQFEFELGLV